MSERKSFWGETHELSSESERLGEKYIPALGATPYVETELLRASISLIYDYYNNGWCNNKTPELDMLNHYGFYFDITDEDLVTGVGNNDYDSDKHLKLQAYMDDEHARVVRLVQAAEAESNFTELKPEDELLSGRWGLSYEELRDLEDEIFPPDEDEWDDVM